MAHWVRVSVVSQAPRIDFAKGGFSLGDLEEIVMKVAADRPDFICFPEICTCLVSPLDKAVRERGHELPGRYTKEIGRMAQQCGANLIVPTLERAGDKVYNSVPLVNTAAQFVGVYRKNYPTIGEIEAGITPGTEAPVFECGGVRVGFAVCFDLNFPEVLEELTRNRARLVFWPSMYWGGRLLLDWALRGGFYLASAYGHESAIIDMSGKFLAQRGHGTYQVTTGRLPPWVTIAINTDREMLHLDENQNKIVAIRKKFGLDVEIDIHDPEGYFTMASLSQDFTVEDVIKEFKLETLRDYLARARAVRAKKLGKSVAGR